VCFVALCVINIKPFAPLKAKFFSNNNSNNKNYNNDDDDDNNNNYFFSFSLYGAVVSALHALLHSLPDCCKLHRIHCICILDCSYLNVRVNKISEINRQINK